MRRKKDIIKRKIKSYKARLNVDGSSMVKVRDYDQTYALVASWNAIRILLSMVLAHNWKTIKLDYVQAFMQAPIERELFMDIPKSFYVDESDNRRYALRLKASVYEQKQAGRVWNKYLVTKLMKIGFVPSEIDECVFYKDGIIYVLYTDESILTGPNHKKLLGISINNSLSMGGLHKCLYLVQFDGLPIMRKYHGQY